MLTGIGIIKLCLGAPIRSPRHKDVIEDGCTKQPSASREKMHRLRLCTSQSHPHRLQKPKQVTVARPQKYVINGTWLDRIKASSGEGDSNDGAPVG